MTDIIALLATVGVIVAILLISRYVYLHRIRDGRADPVIDPSWPSTVRPPVGPLISDPAPEPETSLYYDPNEKRDEL